MTLINTDPSLRAAPPDRQPAISDTPARAIISPGAGIAIDEMLETISRRRRWVAGVTAVTLLLGVAVVLAFPMRYKATTQLTADPRGLQVLANELTPRGQTTEVNAAVVETQARVLASDMVLRRVVESERLDRDPEFNGTPETLFAQAKSHIKGLLGPASGYDATTQALITLRERTKVQPTNGTYVIDINVSTREPQKSARIAQAISEAYLTAESAARRVTGQRTSGSLAAQLEDMRDRVTRAEAEAERFKRENNIVGINGRLVSEQQLADLSSQLTAARALTGEMRVRFEQTDRLSHTGGVADASLEAAQSQVITQLRARYAEAKQVEDDLISNLGPRHPRMASARTQVQSLRDQITQELRRIAAGARDDLDRAQAAEDALAKRLATLSAESGAVNQKLVQLRELEREAQASRSVYESFLTRTREIRAQQEVDTTNTTIISPALPPLKPSGVPPLLILSVAAAFGLSLGAVTAIARDRLDGKVHTTRHMTATTGLPVLAALPALPGKSAATAEDFGRMDAAALRGINRLLDVIGGTTSSHAAVVMVTATEDRARKSAVALQLAMAASRRGQSVLLIDGDPDAPFSRSTAPAAGGTGKAVFTGHRPAGEAATVLSGTNVIVLTNRAGTDIITRAMESFETQFLANPEFELIIIDGGLVNEDPNARFFAEVVTNIALVVQADVTRFAALDEARETLGLHAAKVSGAVFLKDAKRRPQREAA
jgi:succinoglycan biosynthesis transport protein ExoP